MKKGREERRKEGYMSREEERERGKGQQKESKD